MFNLSFVTLTIAQLQIQLTAIVGPLGRITHCKNQQNIKTEKNCPCSARLSYPLILTTINMEQPTCLKEILDENTSFPVWNEIDKHSSDA